MRTPFLPKQRSTAQYGRREALINPLTSTLPATYKWEKTSATRLSGGGSKKRQLRLVLTNRAENPIP